MTAIELNTAIIIIAAGILGSEFLVGTMSSSGEAEREHLIERLRDGSKSIIGISQEIKGILGELSELVERKNGELIALESGIEIAKSDYDELQEKIKTLREIPLPAVDHFGEILKTAERKNFWLAWRFFLLGVIVQAILNILMKNLGFA